ncbi:MAG: hypothetical protein OQK94_01820 [Gammaproteobacteria bacterium]|nr:hypothetical protein [Gammaproteobacteria bacterium]MCW8839846.1 hypothetical protein [Gammaproteobacteria bacterium]MCW8928318.1 hypothetical protein [Gammaproteobacteria bacterium]MCW8958449.1 hypothetical protein [Gammaproteobacteria bacterium]MCW8972474.1 hypothetical protein [Gammaproteobacteria bacterium]
MGHLDDFGKETYMREQGYEWDDTYEAFVSRKQWKLFTRNYLEDHSFDTLRAKLAETPIDGKWQVYANTESEVDIHNIHKHFGAAT